MPPAATCPICMDDLQDAFRLACGHDVHSHCMLKWCLRANAASSRAAHSCPICRARIDGRLQLDSDSDSDASEAPSGNDAHLLVPATAAGLPFWRRLRGPRLPVHARLIAWTAQQLLTRAQRKHAPPGLRRCADKQRDLKNRLNVAKQLQRSMHTTRACGRVKDVIQALQRQRRSVQQSEDALRKHRQTVIQACQRSATCQAFLATCPLPNPPWWR